MKSKTAKLSIAGLFIVAGFLAAVTPMLVPENQNAQMRAVGNLANAFNAPATIDQSAQATKIVAIWLTANPRAVDPGRKYEVEVDGNPITATAVEIMDLAVKKDGGLVVKKLPKTLGVLSAKLVNNETGSGKPPSKCQHEWVVSFSKMPGLEIRVCGSSLLDFVDLIRELGGLPPGLG